MPRSSYGMARAPKYPGLQRRYEKALEALLASKKSLKAREIIAGLRAGGSRYGISPEECDDLDKNFANYTGRAKESRVIISNGPWGGYQLGSAASPSAGAVAAVPTDGATRSTPSSPPTNDVSEMPAEGRQHWESFLHLPVTVALSSHFVARVLSLPNAADNVKWGNPDMLMLRPSPLARVKEFDASLKPELFRRIDMTPECILASIEVKVWLDRDRAKLFRSIAEAGANSRWANEAWLVFVDWHQLDKTIDEDVVSLARSVEVGLLEVRIDRDASGGASGLAVKIHHAAPTRATLRVGELTHERVGILRSAQELLRQWDEESIATFLDVDVADQKARLLLQQALGNLRSQKGFAGDAALKELLRPFRETADDENYVAEVLRATLAAAALAGDVDEGQELTALIGEAADSSLVKKEADALRADLREFGEITIPPDAGDVGGAR